MADPRAEQAVRLRVEGLSRAQIRQALGLRSAKLLNAWLRGTPPPSWTARPNAKDDAREQAVALRHEGRSYNEIARMVGVSKSTLSLWLRDVPLTDEHRAALAERRNAPTRQRAETRKALRLRRNESIIAEARADIGAVSERELFLAGVVAYWAEGAKNKPWARNRGVNFMNSDPGMITLFLGWLRLLGIGPERLSFRVYIHESAEIEVAVRFWANVVHVSPDTFLRTSVKRHSPRTNRKNVGADYHGCLCVRVRRSNDLNLLITGWWQGLAERAGTLEHQSGMV